jgi:C-terminal processing protease CtpA/Prc
MSQHPKEYRILSPEEIDRIHFPVSLTHLPMYTTPRTRTATVARAATLALVSTKQNVIKLFGGRRNEPYIIETPKGKIGVITLDYFSDRNQDRDLSRDVNYLVQTLKVVGLIVDVRDCDRGEHENAMNGISVFLDSGFITNIHMEVYNNDRRRNDRLEQSYYLTGAGLVVETYNHETKKGGRQYYGRNKNESQKLPLNFITNARTGESMEGMVAALKDHKRIRTVGELTYRNCDCRVYVQDDRGYVYEGQSRYWVGPNRECIGSQYGNCAKGVEPDIRVAEDRNGRRGDPQTDAPLKAAVDDIQAQIK